MKTADYSYGLRYQGSWSSFLGQVHKDPETEVVLVDYTGMFCISFHFSLLFSCELKNSEKEKSEELIGLFGLLYVFLYLPCPGAWLAAPLFCVLFSFEGSFPEQRLEITYCLDESWINRLLWLMRRHATSVIKQRWNTNNRREICTEKQKK